VTSEQLFIALDGRGVVAGSGGRYRIEVYSVRDEAGCRWIQLALHGAGRHMITVRQAHGDSAQHVVLALSSWLADPSQKPHVLSVA
jgi:hypothetical protein